ncbi:hypothetical protein AB0G79_00525 [Streptomyces sp. NPDC020807]|uniref:hypothetical protein n=1 Tax=Streptomyces sp. NPDC020807 TaxID=3155119 RepID=UPI0033C76E7C
MRRRKPGFVATVALCLGGALTACGSGDGEGYAAVGAGTLPKGAVAPSGAIMLVPLDGPTVGGTASPGPSGNPGASAPGAPPDSPSTSSAAPGAATPPGAPSGAGAPSSSDGGVSRTGSSGTGSGSGSGSGTRTESGTGTGTGAGAVGTAPAPGGGTPSRNPSTTAPGSTGGGSTGGGSTTAPPPPSTTGPGPSSPAPAPEPEPEPEPALLSVSGTALADADVRWCEKVTVTVVNSGGTTAHPGSVSFATHVIGALGVDWATVTSSQPLPEPIAAGAARTETYRVCVESWRVPLGMRIDTQRVTVSWV